jgi:hypothetical protein
MPMMYTQRLDIFAVGGAVSPIPPVSEPDGLADWPGWLGVQVSGWRAAGDDALEGAREVGVPLMPSRSDQTWSIREIQVLIGRIDGFQIMHAESRGAFCRSRPCAVPAPEASLHGRG